MMTEGYDTHDVSYLIDDSTTQTIHPDRENKDDAAASWCEDASTPKLHTESVR
jgi:hypothetical protein